MYKLAALAAVAYAKKMDVPEEYEWVNDCDWEGTDYKPYMHFGKILKAVDNRDVCLLVGAHIFATADLDTSLTLDRCEWSYGCIGAMLEEGDGEDEFIAKGKKCAKIATEHIPEDGITLPDVGKECAKEYPNLDGSPFAE